MINYFSIQPIPSIATDVKKFWVLEGNILNGQPYIHRTLADGSAELFFHYAGVFDELLLNDKAEKSFASGVSGPSQKFNRFRINDNFGMFGVCLYPYAVQRFFNIPVSSLSNEMPDLTTLLGQEGKDLEEQMMLAGDNVIRAKIMTKYFENKLSKKLYVDKPLFSLINCIIEAKKISSVKELAAKHFLSTRQFERQFKNAAGFSPKLFTRIIRFQSVINQYGNKSKTLTDIAYDCGYYDQSHFIHDFKEFSGYNPRQYFSGNAEGIEWRNS